MSASKESDAGFPWFEEQNFTGWLVQFRAHLRKAGAHVVLDRPRPSDLDAQGNPIPMNAQQRRTFNDEVAEYDRLDNIAFSELMKACRQNVKVKNLSETGEFNTAYELLQRLRHRYYTVDDNTKAKQLLNYHALTQGESESGAEFVDRELSIRRCGIWAYRRLYPLDEIHPAGYHQHEAQTTCSHYFYDAQYDSWLCCFLV